MARHDHMMKQVSARLFPHVITILNLFKRSISNFGSYSSFLSNKKNIYQSSWIIFTPVRNNKNLLSFGVIFLVAVFTKISCQIIGGFPGSLIGSYETPVRFPSLQNPWFLRIKFAARCSLDSIGRGGRGGAVRAANGTKLSTQIFLTKKKWEVSTQMI